MGTLKSGIRKLLNVPDKYQPLENVSMNRKDEKYKA